MTTEISIGLNDGSPIYGSSRIIIRVDDESGGPYLVIRGANDEARDGETGHEFFLQGEAEIDQFAEVCKNMLRQANEVAGQAGAEVLKLEAK